MIIFGENWQVSQRNLMEILADNRYLHGTLVPPNRQLLADPIKNWFEPNLSLSEYFDLVSTELSSQLYSTPEAS
jgi:hypothetical protein